MFRFTKKKVFSALFVLKNEFSEYNSSCRSNAFINFVFVHILQKEKNIQSTWSLNIDHVEIFTCALTSNVFDHICWHETTFQRRRVNCVHCIIKTPITIDEDVNLILEQNDVTHEVEEEEKMWLHGLHYFHKQSNPPFICICFVLGCLSQEGTSVMAARKRKKRGLVATRGPCHSTYICRCTQYIYIYIYFFF